MSDMHENTIEIGGARCRDRTYDIRRVKAADANNNNSLDHLSRIETAHFGVLRSTSGAHVPCAGVRP